MGFLSYFLSVRLNIEYYWKNAFKDKTGNHFQLRILTKFSIKMGRNYKDIFVHTDNQKIYLSSCKKKNT